MREIKFRAWDGNRMRHKGFSVDSHGAAYWTGDYLMEIWPFEEESIMQYTGLKDNTKWEDLTEEERKKWVEAGNLPSQWNGKEIYEGDIVRGEIDIYDDSNKYVAVVEFGEFEVDASADEYTPIHCVGWHYRIIESPRLYKLADPYPHDIEFPGDVEVIGNIYETPELLEEK